MEISQEDSSARTQTKVHLSRVGLVAAAATGGAGVALLAICAPFVVPAFRRICLPYVPATTTQASNA